MSALVDQFCPACDAPLIAVDGPVVHFAEVRRATYLVCLRCPFVTEVDLETGALTDAPGLTVAHLSDGQEHPERYVTPGLAVDRTRVTTFREGRKES
jgi:hypothetical protein